MERTLNASEMKIRNRARILKLIRQGGYSRAEISRLTGLTRAAVTVIIDDFIARGMIKEGEKNSSAVGRKSVGLRLDAAYGWMIGLNISRRAYTVGAVDFGGNILSECSREISAGDEPEKVLGDICMKTEGIMAQTSGRFLGIGITMPGPLDRERGVLLRVPNMEAWNQFPVKAYFENRFSCPVRLDNNSNAAAKAEEVYNKEVQGKSFLELIVDSGLGSGVILHMDNRSVSFDCELGHTCVEASGERCDCGNVGCAEMYASARAIVRYAQSLDPSLSCWKQIADGYLAGDGACAQAVEREAYYLGRMLVNAVNCFKFEAVVFAGDIAYKFYEVMAKKLDDIIVNESIRKKRIKLLTSIIECAAVLPAANLISESDDFQP